MAVTLKLNESDANLTRRMLRAVALSDSTTTLDSVFLHAQARVSVFSEVCAELARIANYIETVEKAG